MTIVGIIGRGVVGQSQVKIFEPHATVVPYDINDEGGFPFERFKTCDFAVICVGTPQGDGGACDISQVRQAIAQVPVDRILLRSTVPPGTTDQLIAATGKEICFSPEYVGENTWDEPSWPSGEISVPFMILGGMPSVRRYFYDQLLPIFGPNKAYAQMSASEAELVKYMENAYLSTKVTFVNEFYELCAAFGCDWSVVREAWLLDPRIGRSHSAIFENDRGFSGRCLPKDLTAIVQTAIEAGYTPEFLLEVLASNERFLKKN